MCMVHVCMCVVYGVCMVCVVCVCVGGVTLVPHPPHLAACWRARVGKERSVHVLGDRDVEGRADCGGAVGRGAEHVDPAGLVGLVGNDTALVWVVLQPSKTTAGYSVIRLFGYFGYFGYFGCSVIRLSCKVMTSSVWHCPIYGYPHCPIHVLVHARRDE